jgi:signal transduction histidine kinase
VPTHEADDCAFPDWLLGSLRTGLLAADASGRLVRLSPEAARVLELGEAAAQLGRPAAEVLAAHPALVALLGEALRGHELPPRAELELTLRGGRERRPIGFTLVPVRDGADVLRGAALLFRDLTPFERQDEQARLRDRLAALGQMAAGLAHEIRNPLASIQVLLELLKRSLGKREDVELVGEILVELDSLTRIVNGSLEFVRPRAAMRAPVALAPLVHEAVRRARARVPFDGRVEIAVEPGLTPTVDALQLESVLVNLIANAFEAMRGEARPGGHALEVAAESAEGELRLRVADSGPGVPPENRERIFYPFFTTRERGTGVGLAEVHKAVVSHGGSVEVRERTGGGALFVIRLPLEERT